MHNSLIVVVLIVILWVTSIRATYNYATWRGKLRRLWAERVFLTREYMISAIEDLPNKSYVADKLMQNQDDIGKTAGMYYGKCQGEYLANLLKTHITMATQTIESIKNKNDVETKKDIDVWRKNSHEIESYLNIGDEMQKHLDLTVAEIRAYLGVHDGSKGRGSDIPVFNETLSHSLVVADKMSQKALSSKWFWFFVHSLVLIE